MCRAVIAVLGSAEAFFSRQWQSSSNSATIVLTYLEWHGDDVVIRQMEQLWKCRKERRHLWQCIYAQARLIHCLSWAHRILNGRKRTLHCRMYGTASYIYRASIPKDWLRVSYHNYVANTAVYNRHHLPSTKQPSPSQAIQITTRIHDRPHSRLTQLPPLISSFLFSPRLRFRTA